MFVKVSGFGANTGIVLPDYLADADPTSVVLALVRWMSPHEDALVRDTEKRPLCSAPFDINHALWRYSKTPHERPEFRRRTFASQRHLFGSDATMQQERIQQHRRAHYDLLDPRTFTCYLNCTPIDGDPDTLMETITLPFNNTKLK